jgi:hypothetical protein
VGNILGALLSLTASLLFWRLYFSSVIFSASACRFNVVGDMSRRRMMRGFAQSLSGFFDCVVELTTSAGVLCQMLFYSTS